MFLHLNEVCKAFFAGRAAEAAIDNMHSNMVFQEIQSVERLRAKDTGIGLLVQVELHMVLQGAGADEALVADVTGQGTVAVSPMETQVLVQLVLLPEGLSTLQALERPEGLAYKKVLQSGIPNTLGSSHVFRRQDTMGNGRRRLYRRDSSL